MSGGSWKAAESRIGTWFGAKGIKKSGRVPLSGGNSGMTRSDSPHTTIFIESKRDKSYHSAIKLWRTYKSKDLYVLAFPIVDDGKVSCPTSDIWCIHNSDLEQVVNELKNGNDIKIHDWSGHYPSALTLYEEAISAKNSTMMDKKKEVVCCALVYHGSPGFWIVINKNDIVNCWKLILEERKLREEMIKEEGL